MKLLEEELGSALFIRLPRGVELTSAGQHLVRHAEVIKIQMTEARAELQALNKGDRGTVRIGAGPAWLRRHLPEVVAQVVSTRPELKITVIGGFDEALLRGLRRGDLDFVVAETPWSQNANDLDVEIVSNVDLCVVAREGHPLAHKSRISIADLLSYPWVLPVDITRARQRLNSLFMSHNISPPEPSVETESMAFMIAMVRSSLALTYTTSTAVEPPDGTGLTALYVEELASERNAAIIRRRTSWTSPTAALVIDALRRFCAENPIN
jgi:LysR family transcriptional regulator of gallate degradation